MLLPIAAPAELCQRGDPLGECIERVSVLVTPLQKGTAIRQRFLMLGDGRSTICHHITNRIPVTSSCHPSPVTLPPDTGAANGRIW